MALTSNIYSLFTLRGAVVSQGIEFQEGAIKTKTPWGSNFEPLLGISANLNFSGCLTHSCVFQTQIDDLELPYLLGSVRNKIVVFVEKPGILNLKQEIVLVQNYTQDETFKRKPSFRVEFGMEARLLTSISGNFGYRFESWELAIVPSGFAFNIAHQFIDERGYPNQVIKYRPGLVVR